MLFFNVASISAVFFYKLLEKTLPFDLFEVAKKAFYEVFACENFPVAQKYALGIAFVY